MGKQCPNFWAPKSLQMVTAAMKLKDNYYPFYDGNETEYYSRLENVVNFIIEQEMTQFCGVETAYIRKLKAMLLYLSDNLPYEVNIAKLSVYLGLNKSTVLSYLSSMQRAELLLLLYSDNKSVKKMQKPDKIYIQNTNMLYAIGSRQNIGTLPNVLSSTNFHTFTQWNTAKHKAIF